MKCDENNINKTLTTWWLQFCFVNKVVSKCGYNTGHAHMNGEGYRFWVWFHIDVGCGWVLCFQRCMPLARAQQKTLDSSMISWYVSYGIAHDIVRFCQYTTTCSVMTWLGYLSAVDHKITSVQSLLELEPVFKIILREDYTNTTGCSLAWLPTFPPWQAYLDAYGGSALNEWKQRIREHDMSSARWCTCVKDLHCLIHSSRFWTLMLLWIGTATC